MTNEIIEGKIPEIKWVDLKELFSLSPKHKKAYKEWKKEDHACICSLCFLKWCEWKKIELPKEWKKYECFWGA